MAARLDFLYRFNLYPSIFSEVVLPVNALYFRDLLARFLWVLLMPFQMVLLAEPHVESEFFVHF